MKSLKLIILFFTLLSGLHLVKAQIVNAGIKFDRKLMFNATLNYPFFFEDKKPYELMLGVDFTTGNDKAPSGLAPQMTFGFFIEQDETKDYLMFGGLTAGYLFDFNSRFENQFRITPHFYFEYFSMLNIKVGMDYTMPLNKAYPFISIGFGGGHMLKNFKVM